VAKLSIGFLGAGYVAGVHASILARDKRTQIIAIYDLDKARAKNQSRSVGAEVAHSVAEVLAMCDTIYITTPNTQLTELAILAAEERKHVFCEKPMATSIAYARRVFTVAGKRGNNKTPTVIYFVTIHLPKLY
jgi:predicted dehydrogenase